jgi:hypothetical protein
MSKDPGIIWKHPKKSIRNQSSDKSFLGDHPVEHFANFLPHDNEKLMEKQYHFDTKNTFRTHIVGGF